MRRIDAGVDDAHRHLRRAVVMSHASGARILAMPHSYAKQASFGVALWRMTWSGPA
jgi:hypothetical protein